MALLEFQGFDGLDEIHAYFTSEWDGGGTHLIQPTNGLDATRCAELGSINPRVAAGTTIKAQGNKVIMGFHHRSTDMTGQFLVKIPSPGGGDALTLALSASGQLQMRRGSHVGTIIGTTTNTFATIDTWRFIEFKVVIDNASGTLDILVDGVNELSLTGLDTLDAWSTWDGGYELWTGGTIGDTHRYDNIYLCDGSGEAPYNDFLGTLTRCLYVPIEADGFASEWLGSDGNMVDNYLLVDDPVLDDGIGHDVDATYVESAAADEDQFFEVTLPSVSGSGIRAIAIENIVRRVDQGVAGWIPLIRVNGTTFAGTAQYPTTAYRVQSAIFTTNPVTDAIWDADPGATIEIGMRRV